MRVPFHVVQQKHRARTRRQLSRGRFDGLRQHAAIAVLFHTRRVFLDLGFDARQPTRASQRVQRAIDRHAMHPRAELCVAAPRRQRAEDLNPDLLRDVFSEIGIAGQSSNNGIDMRRMLIPQQAHGALVALDCPANYGGVGIHGSVESVTDFGPEGCLRRGQSWKSVGPRRGIGATRCLPKGLILRWTLDGRGRSS